MCVCVHLLFSAKGLFPIINKQDDQLELTYSSYLRTQDVTLKTCQRRWIIGRSGERGSGISVLAARHDDDAATKEWRCLFIIFQGPPYSAASGSKDTTIRMWDLLTGCCVHKLCAHDEPVISITCSLQYVISQGQDYRLCVWNRSRGQLLHDIQLVSNTPPPSFYV